MYRSLARLLAGTALLLVFFFGVAVHAADGFGAGGGYPTPGGGQRFLLLSLDWRASDATIAWARAKLAEYPNVPTIISTHELVQPTTDLTSDAAELSGYGQTVWDRLIKSKTQIFMTLNGHFWPSGRCSSPDASHSRRRRSQLYARDHGPPDRPVDLRRAAQRVQRRATWTVSHSHGQTQRRSAQVRHDVTYLG